MDSIIARKTGKFSERPPQPENTVALRHSLLLRMIVILAVFISLTSAALFFGIDHFVTRQFRDLHRESGLQFSSLVRHTVEEEFARMEGMAKLIAEDADLNHATYYHLYLEGEKDHPQAAMERIARAFRLDALSLWDTRGKLIVTAPPHALRPFEKWDKESEARRVVWADGRAWIVAGAPLLRERVAIAWVRVAKPLDAALGAMAAGGKATVRLASGDEAGSAVLRVALPGGGNSPTFLAIDLPDTATRALDKAKQILAVILAISGVLLMGGLAWAVRWQLAPVRELVQAAAAVGRGEFGQRLTARGNNEVAHLVRTFNAMTEDLGKLRKLEQQVRHQEQLSAIGRVAARVAHDINNPLTVISNVAKLMQRQAGADPRLLEDTSLIVHHSARCVRIVELLLAYGRPVRVDLVPLDLVACCREIAARWKTGAGGSPSLQFNARQETLIISGDRYQIEQMLDNLLNNAREACPDGDVLMEVGLVDGEATIRVADQGPGFSQDVRERLFEPFFTTKTGGTGLGLASCLAIARAHGGRIEIAGEGRGEVTVWLPCQADSRKRLRL